MGRRIEKSLSCLQSPKPEMSRWQKLVQGQVGTSCPEKVIYAYKNLSQKEGQEGVP